MIDYDLSALKQQNAILDNAINELNNNQFQLNEKKKENNQIRVELLTKIVMFKPYFKRFLVLRSRETIENNNRLAICNKKKVLSFILGSNSQTQVKFDYILSLFNNFSEVPTLIQSANDYLNEEVVNILFRLTTKHDDSKSVCATYFKPIAEVFNKESMLFPLLNDLVVKLIAVFTEVDLTINLIGRQDFIPGNPQHLKIFPKDGSLNLSLMFNHEFILNAFNSFNNDDKIYGFILTVKLTKIKTSSCLKIIFVDLNSLEIVRCLLARLVDINNAKIKGKNFKSGQKIISKEYAHLVDEIDESFNYFPCFLDLDIGNRIFKGENITFLNEILLKYYK